MNDSRLMRLRSVAQVGSSWANPINAASTDPAAYAFAANGSGGGWIEFAFQPNQIEDRATIVGLEVDLSACQYPTTGAITGYLGALAFTLAAQFSLDGVHYGGSLKRTGDLGGLKAFQSFALGGSSDTWGLSWSPATLNSSTFRLRVYRPIELADEDSRGERSLESVRLTVYYTLTDRNTMPERIADLQLSLIGKEATKGQQVSTTERLKAISIQPQSMTDVKEIIYQGDLVAGDQVVMTESGEAAVTGFATYDEIGWLLASGVSKPVTTSLGGGAYRHVFVFDAKSAANVQTYSHEYGDATYCESMPFLALTDFALNTTRKENGITGKFIGGKMNPGATRSTPPNNDIQTLTVNSATAITFRYKGASTTSVASLSAANIQAALQALSTIGSGNILVSGSGSSYTITGAGSLAGVPLALIEIEAYTGGTGPTVAKTAVGGWNESKCTPVQPGTWTLYYSNVLANLGTVGAKATRLFNANFSIANRFDAVWVMDPAQSAWVATAEQVAPIITKFTIEADALATTIVNDLRTSAPKYMRLESVGPQIGTSGFYNTVTIDQAVKIKVQGNIKAEGKILAREFDASARYDQSWGNSLVITLINEKSGY